MNAKVGEAILTELRKVHSRSYFDRAPENVVFPYVVFSTPSSFKIAESNAYNIIFRCSVYSNTDNNIIDLEKITLDIVKAFDKSRYYDNDTDLTFDIESILQPREEEKNIRRREITFRVKYYNKGV